MWVCCRDRGSSRGQSLRKALGLPSSDPQATWHSARLIPPEEWCHQNRAGVWDDGCSQGEQRVGCSLKHTAGESDGSSECSHGIRHEVAIIFNGLFHFFKYKDLKPLGQNENVKTFQNWSVSTVSCYVTSTTQSPWSPPRPFLT